jgi:predicted acylesterase/phospholipase RssA
MSTQIRRIALGGGGAKGLMHIGALQELKKTQLLDFPDGIYGVSVGAIIASCIAFRMPLDSILTFLKEHSSFESLIPSTFEVQNITKMFANKGVYSMDVFTQRVVELFTTVGIDIQSKKLNDAHMPLYIVSSNITKGVPTIFSGDVSVLQALRCSCAVPFLFHPQQIGDNLYVDGDVLTPNLTSLCPRDTVVINLDKRRRHKIGPSQIESLAASDYARELYNIVAMYNQKKHCSTNTFSLSYPNLNSDSDISQQNIDEILLHSAEKFRRFLSTQVLH